MFLRIFLTVFFISTGIISMSKADEVHSHALDSAQVGDRGYGHQTYHEAYKELFLQINGFAEPGLGDKGYLAEEYGSTYQLLYSSGKCYCKSGYCRPTKLRESPDAVETGYQVLIDGDWYNVPRASLHNEKTLSPELWEMLSGNGDGHVCAYPILDSDVVADMVIECVIPPVTPG